MKKIIFLFLVLFLVSGCETKTIKYADCYLAERVIDGDTFVLQDDSRVRLIGIDSPEKGSFYFEEAKMALNNMIMGKCLVLTNDISDVDIYDRLLRYVYVDGVFVNEYMIELGYAESYPYKPDVKYQDILNKAEVNAKQGDRGIWRALVRDCTDLGCSDDDKYAGSLNSDLYHECDSGFAKRINRENIICFESKEHALDLGYKAGSDVE